MTVRTAIGLLLGAVLTACQHHPDLFQPRLLEPSFMELWHVYNGCRTADQLVRLVIDAGFLQHHSSASPESLPRVFKPVEALIQAQPVRLSADPRAMAADCTLRAAGTANAAGWHDLGIALYRSLLDRFSEPKYSYYRNRAEVGLANALHHDRIDSDPSVSENEEAG
jgi:hypothetical protein